MSPFGVYILCHKADFRLTRGCCESIRRFAGEVPICLIVEGSFSTEALERQYGCQTLRREDIKDESLRTKSFGGWGYSKMVAFWEGPFERFLYLDSDTIMLGNVCAMADEMPVDMIIPEVPATLYQPEAMNVHWLNPEFVARNFPSYRIYDHPYFTTGVFFGRKGLFELGEYLRLLDLQRAYPKDSFRPVSGEQGLLNFLVFSAAAAGRLTYAVKPLQICPLYMEKGEVSEINEALRSADGEWKGPRAVIHYVDVKPSLLHEGWARRSTAEVNDAWTPPPGWPSAMNKMRLQSYAACGYPYFAAIARVLAQDLRYHGEAMGKRLRSRLKTNHLC